MTQTLYSQTYANNTTEDPDEAKTINLRLEAFDVEYHNETQVAIDISESYSLDASATAVIFVKTEDMRSTFQFSAGTLNLTDRTDFSDNDRLNFYVLDKNDLSGTDFGVNPTWRWDCSAEDTDASYIINVAHAMMDASGSFPHHKSLEIGEDGPILTSHDSFLNVSDDERQRFALVKHDFVRHIIEVAYGGVAVIHNLDELCKSFEDGGINGWNTIRQNLKAASNHQRLTEGKTGGQNYNVTNNTANPCRSLFNQLRLRNPDRFNPSGSLSNSIENKIFETNDPQPLPFIHGDILEFTFKASTIEISGADPKDPTTIAVPARTYRIKLCCVDGSGNNNEYNTLPPVDNYDFGATYYDSSINSVHNTLEAHRVEAKLENQRFYEINKENGEPGPVPDTEPAAEPKTFDLQSFEYSYEQLTTDPAVIPAGYSLDTSGAYYTKDGETDQAIYLRTWEDDITAFSSDDGATFDKTWHQVSSDTPLNNYSLTITGANATVNFNTEEQQAHIDFIDPYKYDLAYEAVYKGFNGFDFVLLRLSPNSSNSITNTDWTNIKDTISKLQDRGKINYGFTES